MGSQCKNTLHLDRLGKKEKLVEPPFVIVTHRVKEVLRERMGSEENSVFGVCVGGGVHDYRLM